MNYEYDYQNLDDIKKALKEDPDRYQYTINGLMEKYNIPLIYITAHHDTAEKIYVLENKEDYDYKNLLKNLMYELDLSVLDIKMTRISDNYITIVMSF